MGLRGVSFNQLIAISALGTTLVDMVTHSFPILQTLTYFHLDLCIKRYYILFSTFLVYFSVLRILAYFVP